MNIKCNLSSLGINFHYSRSFAKINSNWKFQLLQFDNLRTCQIQAEKFKYNYKDLKIELLYFNYLICELAWQVSSLATWPSIDKYPPIWLWKITLGPGFWSKCTDLFWFGNLGICTELGITSNSAYFYKFGKKIINLKIRLILRSAINSAFTHMFYLGHLEISTVQAVILNVGQSYNYWSKYSSKFVWYSLLPLISRPVIIK